MSNHLYKPEDHPRLPIYLNQIHLLEKEGAKAIIVCKNTAVSPVTRNILRKQTQYILLENKAPVCCSLDLSFIQQQFAAL